MTFTIPEEVIPILNEWLENHECKFRNTLTTIGEKYTYSFTPTGVGTFIKVKCACGKSIDLSEYIDY